jgi:hypothetical protein
MYVDTMLYVYSTVDTKHYTLTASCTYGDTMLYVKSTEDTKHYTLTASCTYVDTKVYTVPCYIYQHSGGFSWTTLYTLTAVKRCKTIKRGKPSFILLQQETKLRTVVTGNQDLYRYRYRYLGYQASYIYTWTPSLTLF